MSEIDYPNAAHNMTAYGGSFVQKLGEAWFLADSTNKELLQQVFSNYFEQYGKINNEK